MCAKTNYMDDSAKITDMEPAKLEEMREQNPWMPRWPFRMNVIGGSGTGKTNVVMNMIMKYWVVFDTFILCAGDIEEPKYEQLKEWCEATAEDRQEAIDDYAHKMKLRRKPDSSIPKPPLPFRFLFTNAIDALPPIAAWEHEIEDKSEVMGDNNKPLHLRQHPEGRRTLILIDDMINEKYQGPVSKLFTQGRKKNITTIYIAQSYFAIPSMIRTNTTHFLIFGGLGTKNVKDMSRGMSTGLDADDFLALYRFVTQKSATSDSNPFLYIDINGKRKFRLNFDSVLVFE